MWIPVIIFILFLLFLNDTSTQPTVDGYKAKFFGERSRAQYNMMKNDGLSTSSLKEFLIMEDQFLSYERETVCHKVSRIRNAAALSRQIKDRFQGYDFSYHDDVHLKQMDSPDRAINKELTCY